MAALCPVDVHERQFGAIALSLLKTPKAKTNPGISAAFQSFE